MRGYSAFLKKELIEQVRTYRLFIMLTVFFIFGMMSPLAAKLLPEILASAMPEGISITLADPVALDSWSQFFKNISQMGLIVTVILFGGVLSTELSKGTLINMLTKGLSRSAVIASKFSAMILLWTAAYALAFLVGLGYTAYLFPGQTLPHLGFSVFCLWMFGVFLLSTLLLAASLTKNTFGALLLLCLVLGGLLLANIFPDWQAFNPLMLSSQNVALLGGATAVSEMTKSLIVTASATVAFLGLSVVIFRKRAL